MQYSFGHFEPFDVSLNLTTTEEKIATEPNSKNKIIYQVLKNINEQIKSVLNLLESEPAVGTPEGLAILTGEAMTPRGNGILPKNDGARVLEGVFDGRSMVGSDGTTYPVPPNYASKSKLVEGDLLKLTITPTGAFIYKQIGPAERNRVVATLGFDETSGEFYAASDHKRWSILRASVTYYKGDVGDEIILLLPKNISSAWAAVENIVKRNPLVSINLAASGAFKVETL